MTRVAVLESNRASQQRRRVKIRERHAAGLIAIPQVKRCGYCGTEKLAEDFSRSINSHDGLYGHCRSCDAIQQKERVRLARERDPEGYKQRRAAITRKYRYGLSDDEFNLLAELQEFSCAICGVLDTLCVDHDHKTGAVRGLLCRACNSGIGQMNDDPDRIAQAVSYLLKGNDALSRA